MQTGLDTNGNDVLDETETVSEAVLCNGTMGQNGTHGSTGASALVDKTDAPTYLCVDGFVVRFGVDDGAGDGVAGNHVLEADEVRETLNFCFEPLRSERVTDLSTGISDSFDTNCDAAVWMEELAAMAFAGNDGVHGC